MQRLLTEDVYKKSHVHTYLIYVGCSLKMSDKDSKNVRSLQIQGRSPTENMTQESDGEQSDQLDESALSIELPLPPCELGKLEEVSDLLTTAISSPVHREGVALAMEREGYIPKLLQLFHVCEDLENTEGLHNLYNIFRSLFLINKPSLLSIMFQDENIVSVIGCLEYNPNKPHPVRHRDYLAQVAKHTEVIPFNNPQLLNKVGTVHSPLEDAPDLS